MKYYRVSTKQKEDTATMVPQVEDNLDTIVIYVISDVLEVISSGILKDKRFKFSDPPDTQNHGIDGNQEALFEKCSQRTLFECIVSEIL